LDQKKSLSVKLTSDQTRKIVLFAQRLKSLCECLGNLLLLPLIDRVLCDCDLYRKKHKKYPKPWTENVHQRRTAQNWLSTIEKQRVHSQVESCRESCVNPVVNQRSFGMVLA
jgi:hypothetical protein